MFIKIDGDKFIIDFLERLLVMNKETILTF